MSADMVVVANRLPVSRIQTDDGPAWQTSPGGLVSAVMPILQRQSAEGGSGCWVGWSGNADERIDPFEHDGVRQVPVALSKNEIAGYYEGMANQTIWPLYHDVIRPPGYHRHWYRVYKDVNRSFAEAAAEQAADGAIVWVQDYHLHLVPGMLRELRPDLRIGFFLHIPFPGRGLFAQLPWRSEMLRGTLGADVVGFQTALGAGNFRDLAAWYADAEITETGVRIDGRDVIIDAFPISIDAKKFESIAKRPEVKSEALEIRRRLYGRTILLGVDRLDYTKGIDLRLRAFQDLLHSESVSPKEVVLIQSGVPTRERVEDYAGLRSNVEELVGQINGEFGEVGLVAVQYLRRNLPIEELVALYLAADVMLVTPFRDGMNLVAKEFVATHHDNRGSLVLSEFTGSAAELKEAVIVNPHDLDGMMQGMLDAIRMPPDEVTRRLNAMRQTVFDHDVYAWAGKFLERLRA